MDLIGPTFILEIELYIQVLKLRMIRKKMSILSSFFESIIPPGIYPIVPQQSEFTTGRSMFVHTSLDSRRFTDVLMVNVDFRLGSYHSQ